MAMIPLDLADIAAGIGVYVIRGQDAGDLSGGSVAAAGDINGDEPDDLIIRCGTALRQEVARPMPGAVT